MRLAESLSIRGPLLPSVSRAALALGALLPALPAAAQGPGWIDQLESAGPDEVRGVAADGAGVAFLAGTTCCTLVPRGSA